MSIKPYVNFGGSLVEHPDGGWVLWSEHETAMKDMERKQAACQPSKPDNSTNQLINQLYHDLARHQKVLKKLIGILDEVDGKFYLVEVSKAFAEGGLTAKEAIRKMDNLHHAALALVS